MTLNKIWMLLFLLCLVLTAGCAAAPEVPSERALYMDLRRVVETRQRVDWVVDNLEAQAAAAVTMRSVCRVDASVRASTLAWVEAEVEALGGPASKVYAANGGDLGEVDELLTLERVGLLLRDGEARAASDCPFWLTPEEAFEGVHSSAGRFILLLESRGGGALWLSGGEVLFGGGGGGRLMPGWGVSDAFSMAMGVEVGGSGLVSSSAEADALSATVNAAIPFVMRFHDTSLLFDVELAAVAFSKPSALDLTPGGRVALGVGARTPRVSSFMPVGTLQLGYELHPARGSFGVTHIIFIGTRVGVEGGW